MIVVSYFASAALVMSLICLALIAAIYAVLKRGHG